MISMTEEKSTANSIAFVVDINADAKLSTEEPEVKKRLEEQSANAGAEISLEQINEKLEKAEEKRLSFHQHKNDDEKRNKVAERKSSLEKQALEHNTKIEAALSRADDNRE